MTSRARVLAVTMHMVAMIGAVGLASSDPAEFHAYLLPEASTVYLGETTEVRFEVDSTAAQFNGYQVTIQYDPTIVDLLEVQEGDLMTGACGSTFFVPSETETTITVAHVILCGSSPSALDGPGVLSVYTFAGLAEGVSALQITSHPDSTFADAGVPLNPDHPTYPRQVIFHEGSIEVVEQIAVADQSPARALRLDQNVPNPFNPSTFVTFQVIGSGPVRFAVFDAHGRRVWQRAWRHLPSGLHRIGWNGTGLDGRPLPSGVYLYRIYTLSGARTRKMTLVR